MVFFFPVERTPANMAGSLFKSLGRDIGWAVMYSLVRDMKKKGDVTRLYRRAEFLGRLAYRLVGSRRRLMLSNLRTAFPDWPEERVQKTARLVVRNLCRGFIDLFSWDANKDAHHARTGTENAEYLQQVASEGKGFILATGHVGVFPFVGIPVMEMGLLYGTVARDPHDERVADLFRSTRDNVGIYSIPDSPPRTTLKKVFHVLRKGGGVLYTFDMHPGGRGGVTADFMGAPTPMFGGIVRLAARKKAPLLPCYVIREPDGVSHRVIFHPPFTVPPEAKDENSPETRKTVQRLATWLSGVIRKYPEQWWWIHRRWRPQDNGEKAPQKS